MHAFPLVCRANLAGLCESPFSFSLAVKTRSCPRCQLDILTHDLGRSSAVIHKRHSCRRAPRTRRKNCKGIREDVKNNLFFCSNGTVVE